MELKELYINAPKNPGCHKDRRSPNMAGVQALKMECWPFSKDGRVKKHMCNSGRQNVHKHE